MQENAATSSSLYIKKLVQECTSIMENTFVAHVLEPLWTQWQFNSVAFDHETMKWQRHSIAFDDEIIVSRPYFKRFLKATNDDARTMYADACERLRALDDIGRGDLPSQLRLEDFFIQENMTPVSTVKNIQRWQKKLENLWNSTQVLPAYFQKVDPTRLVTDTSFEEAYVKLQHEVTEQVKKANASVQRLSDAYDYVKKNLDRQACPGCCETDDGRESPSKGYDESPSCSDRESPSCGDRESPSRGDRESPPHNRWSSYYESLPCGDFRLSPSYEPPSGGDRESPPHNRWSYEQLPYGDFRLSPSYEPPSHGEIQWSPSHESPSIHQSRGMYINENST
jgi:hypothetical protein